MRILAEETGAIIIDMQEKLVPSMWNAKACEEKVTMLIQGLRILGIPMIITQQYTKGLGNSLASIYEAAGTTAFFDKSSFSCYKDEVIKKAFLTLNRKNIIIMGVETHVCVLQTCLDCKATGLRPILVADAVGSRKQTDMEIGIQRAIQENILVTTAEAVLFELMSDSKNPHFKEISKLVK